MIEKIYLFLSGHGNLDSPPSIFKIPENIILSFPSVIGTNLDLQFLNNKIFYDTSFTNTIDIGRLPKTGTTYFQMQDYGLTNKYCDEMIIVFSPYYDVKSDFLRNNYFSKIGLYKLPIFQEDLLEPRFCYSKIHKKYKLECNSSYNNQSGKALLKLANLTNKTQDDRDHINFINWCLDGSFLSEELKAEFYNEIYNNKVILLSNLCKFIKKHIPDKVIHLVVATCRNVLDETPVNKILCSRVLSRSSSITCNDSAIANILDFINFTSSVYKLCLMSQEQITSLSFDKRIVDFLLYKDLSEGAITTNRLKIETLIGKLESTKQLLGRIHTMELETFSREYLVTLCENVDFFKELAEVVQPIFLPIFFGKLENRCKIIETRPQITRI
jgi:hypothetical protein